ncbi:MAG: NAD-dependent epimerase/dehydratase [Gammaproteobacteria bacterium]|nr:NAD-dependent epimerase/dehydratase [Gammaproteobacteria bacterium]
MSTTMNGDRKRLRKAAHDARHQRPVLVCGGAGFIGTHLCNRLLADGKRVICVDNFCTSTEDSVAIFRGHPGFTLRRQDVATLRDDDVPPVGAIFNLACAASPVHYQREPLDTLFSNIDGMNNLLRMAKLYGAPIFQASTSEIYGHPTTHPQNETYWGHVNSFGPRSCYDEGKRCAETLCYIYQKHHGVAVRIARIFNTYGPGMMLSDGRVIVNFIAQALSNEPITVYGNGSQTRSFCYVDDLIEGIVLLMAPKNQFAGPVNLGNPAEISVADLAAKIVRFTGSGSPIVCKPLPVDDPPRRRPNVALAFDKLGWRPAVDLDAGLERTVHDVKQRLGQRCATRSFVSEPASQRANPGMEVNAP